MYYNNTAASDGQNATGVWNANYVGVWHLEETVTDQAVTANVHLDSTAGANHADQNRNDDLVAKISRGQDLNAGTPPDAIDAGTTVTALTGEFTVEAWIFSDDADASTDTLIAQSTNGAAQNFTFEKNRTTSKLSAVWGNVVVHTSTATVPTGSWQHVVLVRSGSSGSWTSSMYINGALDSSVGTGFNSNAGAGPTTCFGALHNSGAQPCSGGVTNDYDGKLDEIRLSNTDRSADWIEAEYLSMANDSFATYGAEESPTGPWKFKNNTTPADGASIASSLLTGTDALESYTESNPTVNNLVAINSGQQGEWDFSLDPTNLTCAGGTYFFRMVKANGTALATYTVYPEITIDSSAPVDSAMRHGRWFDNSVEQPFSCNWMG
jgi:hypothetical protein